MVEVEISFAGTFFLGPLKDIGFVDLTDELSKPRRDGPRGSTAWFARALRRIPRGASSRWDDARSHLRHSARRSSGDARVSQRHLRHVRYRGGEADDVGRIHRRRPQADEGVEQGRSGRSLSDGPLGYAFDDIEVLLFQRDGGVFHSPKAKCAWTTRSPRRLDVVCAARSRGRSAFPTPLAGIGN